MVRAFGIVFDEMTAKGFKPKLQTMDNEASAALKKYFMEKEMNYQLATPHCHRTSAAERAIITFKDHFKSGLDTVDPYFLTHIWDRLLLQAEITLNLLRASRLHPQLSATAQYQQRLDPQVARSLHMKNCHKYAPGQHMNNLDGLWALPCNIIGVNTCISQQRQVSA
jgi:hypothetical protein